jgi:hypothetical protein
MAVWNWKAACLKRVKTLDGDPMGVRGACDALFMANEKFLNSRQINGLGRLAGVEVGRGSGLGLG